MPVRENLIALLPDLLAVLLHFLATLLQQFLAVLLDLLPMLLHPLAPFLERLSLLGRCAALGSCNSRKCQEQNGGQYMTSNVHKGSLSLCLGQIRCQLV